MSNDEIMNCGNCKGVGWSLDSFNNRVEELEREAVLRLKHEFCQEHFIGHEINEKLIDEIFGSKLT